MREMCQCAAAERMCACRQREDIAIGLLGLCLNMYQKKGRSKLGAISRLRHHLDSANLETMYKSFVRSSLEYGNLEYLSAAPSHLEDLEELEETPT